MNSRGWKLTRGEAANQYVADQTAKVQDATATLERLKQENFVLCARPEFLWITQRSACNANDLTLSQLSNNERLRPESRESFMAFYSESKDINKQRLEVLKSMGGKKNMAIADVFSDSINQRERSALDLYDGKGVGALLDISYTTMAYVRDFQHELPLSPS
jgi:hypothetical protein